jgi:hypothetical protein
MLDENRKLGMDFRVILLGPSRSPRPRRQTCASRPLRRLPYDLFAGASTTPRPTFMTRCRPPSRSLEITSCPGYTEEKRSGSPCTHPGAQAGKDQGLIERAHPLTDAAHPVSSAYYTPIVVMCIPGRQIVRVPICPQGRQAAGGRADEAVKSRPMVCELLCAPRFLLEDLE